jgi:hypothetical protein
MLTVTPISDLGEIGRICADPYVSRAGHDHRPTAPIQHPAASYLGAFVRGGLVGAFLIIRSGAIEWDVHSLLTRKALPWCRQLGRMCLDWCFGHKQVQRVTAYVTEGLESARNYCLRLGFVLEGFRRSAASVNGRLLGLYVLGMTREDWGRKWDS